MTRNRLTRRGITLVEMMVAMALSLGIMLILTESFKMALDFVRGANSTGELMSQLNGAGILMTRDLQTEHFMPDTTKPNNGVKLSDQRLDQAGWTPVTGGFFRIVAPSTGAPESVDPQGFNINAPAVNHQLHFTSYLPIGASASSFTVNSGGTTYSSQYAEIAYFLAPMGKSTAVTPGGQPLYNLIRRQRLVAQSPDEVTGLTPAAGDKDVISAVGPNVNTMALVMDPANRLSPLAPFPPANAARYGEDIVVSNVLSFEILADWTGANAAAGPRPFAIPTNTDAPYDFLNGNPMFPGGVFDTGVLPTPPMMVRIKSLQVTIRVYDPRVKTTRQNTWKFAM